MALDVISSVEIIEIMENYLSKIRPPKDIRDKLDICYRIENQSVIIYEIRPVWNDHEKVGTHDFGKATYDKRKSEWKIYWRRASGKWELYQLQPVVKTLSDFLKILDADELGCFKG